MLVPVDIVDIVGTLDTVETVWDAVGWGAVETVDTYLKLNTVQAPPT